MNKQSEQELIERIKKNPIIFRDDTIEQTEKICLGVVSEYPTLLEFVKVQTEAICLTVIKEHPFMLCYVKDQTEKICLEAVKRDGSAIEFVKDKTDEIYKEALNNNFKASIPFVTFERNSTAMIVLEVFVKKNIKNKIILTKILNKFSKDQEILNFYTKHKLWNYVDFYKLNDNTLMPQYGMVL